MTSGLGVCCIGEGEGEALEITGDEWEVGGEWVEVLSQIWVLELQAQLLKADRKISIVNMHLEALGIMGDAQEVGGEGVGVLSWVWVLELWAQLLKEW